MYVCKTMSFDGYTENCIFTAVFFENTVLYRYTVHVPIQLNLFMACIFLAS